MSVELASEIWSQLKRHISSVDRGDAAEELVTLLIDNDYSADDIRDDFKGDSHIKAALAAYIEHHGDSDDYSDDDDDDYDDYDDDEDDEDY